MSQMLQDDGRVSRPENLGVAFQQWKSARVKLAHTIKHYMNASAGLCGALSFSVSCRSTEQALAEINSELESLQLDEQHLYHTRSTLSNARNMSRDLVPIHRLPREVQGAIFALSHRCCPGPAGRSGHPRSQASSETFPMTLAGVCFHWRKLVLGLPSLWSHIDVVFRHDWRLLSVERTELWVERSHGVLLDIHIWEGKVPGTELLWTPPTNEAGEIVKFLVPLMPRAMNLRICVSSQVLLDEVIRCWIKHSLVTVPKSLHIHSPSVLGKPLILRSWSATESENSKVFLACYRLTLQSCLFRVPASFHGGLVELRLERLFQPLDSPTLPELLAILTANPRLRILVLVGVCIRSLGGQPAPVTMNYLEFLTIGSINCSYNYDLLLPLLSIGSETLNLSLCLLDDPGFIAASHSFLRRTNVTTLRAQAISSSANLAAILCPIPHVQAMAIDGSGAFWNHSASLLTAHFDNHECNLWPSLHTLYLNGGVFPIQLIRELAGGRSVRELRMYGSHVFEFDSSMTEGARKQLHEIMSGVEDFRIY